MQNSYEKLLPKLPELFEISLSSDKNGAGIFRKIEKFLCFHDAFIYFANTNSLQLKYSYKKHANYEIDRTFKINTEIKNFIFSKNSKILNSDSKLIKAVELNDCRHKSFMVAKISIKSTVFGIILLTKREENFYTNYDLYVLQTISSILAYILKDNELSNVFKLQLKALKDGIVEKNEAYKTIKE